MACRIAEELFLITGLGRYLEGDPLKENGIRSVPEVSVASAPKAALFLPMTDAQREVWIASQLSEDVSRTYNGAYVIRAHGPLRDDLLRESLQEIVNRHDAFRTTFASDGGGQIIAEHIRIDLRISSIDGCEDDMRMEQRLEERIHAETTKVFELSMAPLFRFHLFDLGEQRWVVLLVIHHVVADGWSWGIILEELGEIYSAKIRGCVVPDHPTLQYSDYVSWMELPSQRKRVAAAEAYWLKLLADKPAEVELPKDRPRPSQKTFASGHLRYAFDAALIPRLNDAARTFQCTLFQLFMASFCAWLHRVTSLEDMVVAVPVAGQVSPGLRERPSAVRLVGHCVNMLPIRVSCERDVTFHELIQQVRTRLLAARYHQNASFNNLIDKLQWPRDPSRIPLASVSLNLDRVRQVQLEGVVAETQWWPKAYNFFDLTVDVLESRDELVIDCKFNSGLFDQSSVTRWLVQWERMLTAALTNPEMAIGKLELLAEDERRQLMIEWNATEREFSSDACLHHLVAQQVELVPEKIAVACGGITLTYRELDQRANRLARRLMKSGVQPGVLVGVCVDRSVDMVVAVLGVLKAGGAYVPLDPAYPADRIQYVLDDAQAQVLITENLLVRALSATKAEIVCLDRDAESIARFDSAPISARACATDLAYVIYTSGSTGKPKGVEIEHKAIVNFLLSMQREPGFGPEDLLLAVTTLSFDIAGLELYLPLITGGEVVIARREEVQDPVALVKRLCEREFTIMQATPTMWRSLLSVGWKGSSKLKLLCGGEAFPGDLVRSLLAHSSELWNMYGPTETTVWSTVHRIVRADGLVPIGHPIANTQVYVLDVDRNVVPRGVIGELYIGGDGLARGYWGRPELTKERFVSSPFLPDTRLYRTGDLACWNSDGLLECLGRVDNQVKIRGFRIELGEIEAVLGRHPAIKQCVVVAREDTPGDKRLVAYFEVQDGAAVSVSDLRDGLKKELPGYMLPAVFVSLNSLPLTPNGKIDRKGLPVPERNRVEAGREFLAPRDCVEQMLAEIWSKVLEVKQIGLEDDFFESGGNSLSAVAMLIEVQKATGQMAALGKFLQRPTIKTLAAMLREDGLLLSSPTKKRNFFLVETLQSIRECVLAPLLYLRRCVSRLCNVKE